MGDPAGSDVERSEEPGGAVAEVVMCAGLRLELARDDELTSCCAEWWAREIFVATNWSPFGRKGP
jgi:hypothetical protein